MPGKRKRDGKKEAKEKVKRATRGVVAVVYDSWEVRAKAWADAKTPYLEAFRQLARDGYCVIRDVVSEREVATWKSELAAVEALMPEKAGALRGIHGIRQWGAFGHLRLQHLIRAHRRVRQSVVPPT